MKTWLTLLSFAISFSAFGKAAYHSRDQAIKSAEIIAIVDIKKIEPTKTKGRGWTYSQVAEAEVEQVLKGELPRNVKLHGGENFICAQVKYKPGKHLVFLNHDGELLAGANWHLGVLPITGDSVQWFETNGSIQTKPTLLRTAIEEIEAAMENDWPVLVHLQHGSRNPVPKLKFACWQDGTVLLRGDDDQLLVGTVEHPEFWKMWSTLREAKFFSIERKNFIAFDIGYETIIANSGSESAVRSWNVGLKPRTPETANKSSEYLDFIQMWKKSAAAIKELTPGESRPLSEVAKDGKFRGYIVERPAETEWLNNRKWKTRPKASDRAAKQTRR